MKKTCLMNGFAALALGLAVVGCSHESDGLMPSKADQIANATEKLGVEIDPNQDWNMTSTAKAAITVNGDFGETYTVKVFANDPLVDRVAYVLASGQVANGETFTKDFEYASADTRLIVSVSDSKGFTTYKSAAIREGKLETQFGSEQAAGARSSFRSENAPSVPHISTVPDDDYAKSYLEGATEPNSDNVGDDYDNSAYAINYGTGGPNDIDWNNADQVAEKNYFFSLSWENQIAYAKANHPSWIVYNKDETYVTKFKVMGSYTGNIDVFGRRPTSMYIGNGGTWTLSNENGNANYTIGQTANAGSVIVVDNGGTLVIPQYAKLDLANEARLVVMPGGTVRGAGEIAVHNGNAAGLEGYNGGTIDIATFNNNFGKFYNYGTFKATLLKGGAKQSNFYNHGVVHITRTGVKAENGDGNYENANTRIYNACQWYCEKDMHSYVLELAGGSYFYVGGELNLSDGTDGTATNSYVSMASGALLRAGTLSNNNTSWYGPTSGYAVAEVGGITYINWTGQPISDGYIINNIAFSVEDKTIGAGQGQGVDTYVALRDFVLNGHGSTGNVFDPIGKETVGNGNAVLVAKGGANVTIPRSEDFETGVKGCTPGYNGVPSTVDPTPTPTPDPTPDPDPEPDPTPTIVEERPSVWSYAFEDTPLGDYDMNDVVLKVSYAYDETQKKVDYDHLSVTLCCTGATLELKAYLGDQVLFGDQEVHKALSRVAPEMVNTGAGPTADPYTITINTPDDFEFGTADFWISSPLVPGGVHVAKRGEDPHGVVIPADWAWPTEYTNIKVAYPNFIEFAKDASTTNEAVKGWYKKTDTNPVAGKTFKQ